MSLVARHLEANGIPTVVIATARDIVESAAVPRLLFVDFPLGAPCGEPWNVDQQRQILERAFQVLESAATGRTTVDAGLSWSGGEAWKELVFSEAQPFLPGEAGEAWLKKKEAYRQLKAEGKV
ncbi:MAG: hypothetical protein U1E23_17595 [Reyranellaceae bacterium]